MRITLMPLGTDAWFGGELRPSFELWQIADAKGIDGLSMTDHIVVGDDMSAHPHSYGGIRGHLAARYEPIVVLSMIAALTSRIALGTNILLAGLRPATLLARQIQSLDVLSGGRTEFAFGVGWQKFEYDAQGAPWDRRFGLLIETIEACRALWSSAPASFEGEHTSFKNAYCLPLPVQPGGPPILLGIAPTERNIDRIARHAAGWSPLGLPIDEVAHHAGRIRERMREIGRDPAAFRLKVQPHPIRVDGEVDTRASIAEMADWARIGVTDIEYVPAAHCTGPGDFEAFLDDLIAFRATLSTPAASRP